MVANEPLIEERLQGLIIGAALGDALGLPSEGLNRSRLAKRWPGPLTHRLLFGKGMGSDDTEHLFHAGQALLHSCGEPALFQAHLARSLRWWLLALPAGVGLATARSLLKLWLGWKPGNNGVFSAGNGPAMRSGIIGAVYAGSPSLMVQMVNSSTWLTHTDPKALTGALAIAHTAAWIRNGQAPLPELFATWRSLADDRDAEWARLMTLLESHHASGSDVRAFASAIGCPQRVSGYIYQTVPVSLYTWLYHRGDFQTTLSEAVSCGGDTDTVAAIAGALAGLEVGLPGIPETWRHGWWDWPLTQKRLLHLGSALADTSIPCPTSPSLALVLPRNLFFLFVVLFHGFRRLLPPY